MVWDFFFFQIYSHKHTSIQQRRKMIFFSFRFKTKAEALIMYLIDKDVEYHSNRSETNSKRSSTTTRPFSSKYWTSSEETNKNFPVTKDDYDNKLCRIRTHQKQQIMIWSLRTKDTAATNNILIIFIQVDTLWWQYIT